MGYDRFHTCAFAVDPKYGILKTEYKACVDKKVEAVIKKFDDFWSKWEPKLQEHFICGYKCTARVTTPCLRLLLPQTLFWSPMAMPKPLGTITPPDLESLSVFISMQQVNWLV